MTTAAKGAPAYQKLEGNDSTVSAFAPPSETPPRCSRRLRLGVIGVVIVLVIAAKLYLSAVQIAMEKGYHYRFVGVHTAHMNRITSHGACPFLLWHRRYILGYENMLRSLHPKFANLTLPYWDYFEDTSSQTISKRVMQQPRVLLAVSA
ncbi:hypothetical protein PINS_up023354 [Pythium insidiosum]|nr:hypothetical protein PINS_up023354 [Pythium insidiosum]